MTFLPVSDDLFTLARSLTSQCKSTEVQQLHVSFFYWQNRLLSRAGSSQRAGQDPWTKDQQAVRSLPQSRPISHKRHYSSHIKRVAPYPTVDRRGAVAVLELAVRWRGGVPDHCQQHCRPYGASGCLWLQYASVYFDCACHWRNCIFCLSLVARTPVQLHRADYKV